jgi:hypothetical protein
MMTDVEKIDLLTNIIDEMSEIFQDREHTMGHGVDLCIAIVEKHLLDTRTATDHRYQATLNMLRAQGEGYDREYLIETFRIIVKDKELSPEYKLNRIKALLTHADR